MLFIESLALDDHGNGSGILYAIEICDPVEADSYTIYGQEVSNFVTPWWFGNPLPAGAKYDFLGKLLAPFSMTAGGYFSSRSIDKTNGIGPWKQAFADLDSIPLSKLFSTRRLRSVTA